MDQARRDLAQLFRRNGVIRVPSAERRESEKRTYKKGYEVRLVAFSRAELSKIRKLVERAGFPLGKPFAKVNRFVQPIYGREAVEEFRRMIADAER